MPSILYIIGINIPERKRSVIFKILNYFKKISTFNEENIDVGKKSKTPLKLLELISYCEHLIETVTLSKYSAKLGQKYVLNCHVFDIVELTDILTKINNQLLKGSYKSDINLPKKEQYTVDDLFIDKNKQSYIDPDKIQDFIIKLNSFCIVMSSYENYDYGIGEHNYRTLSDFIDSLNKICSGLIFTRV